MPDRGLHRSREPQPAPATPEQRWAAVRTHEPPTPGTPGTVGGCWRCWAWIRTRCAVRRSIRVGRPGRAKRGTRAWARGG
jgi:hypothetical protein